MFDEMVACHKINPVAQPCNKGPTCESINSHFQDKSYRTKYITSNFDFNQKICVPHDFDQNGLPRFCLYAGGCGNKKCSKIHIVVLLPMHINNGRYILANQCIYSNCFCWHCKTEFEAFKDIDLTVVFVEPESMIDMDFPLTENVVNIRKNNKSSGGNQYLNTRAKLRNTQTSQLACDSPIGLVYPNQSDTLQIEGENPSFRCQTPIKQRNEPVPPSFARQVLKATRQIQKPCGNTQPEFQE